MWPRAPITRGSLHSVAEAGHNDARLTNDVVHTYPLLSRVHTASGAATQRNATQERVAPPGDVRCLAYNCKRMLMYAKYMQENDWW